MTTETLEKGVGIEVRKIKVDGKSYRELASATLTPEEIRSRAGLSSKETYNKKDNLYAHNHCQYQRCT